MAEPFYAFQSMEDLRRIARSVLESEARLRTHRPLRERRGNSAREDFLFGKADGSFSVPSYQFSFSRGDMTVWDFDPDAPVGEDFPTLIETERTVRVLSAGPIAGGVLLRSERHFKTGQWIGRPIFERVQGNATAAVTAEDSTFDIDNVVATLGMSPLNNPGSSSETLTIQNDMAFALDDGGLVYAEYHAGDNQWFACQGTCPA